MLRKRIGVLAVLAVSAASFLLPAAASADPTTPTVRSSPTGDPPAFAEANEYYEGTAILEDPRLGEDVLARLGEYGVESDNVANMQIPADGEGALFVMDDNTWVLDTAPSTLYEVSAAADDHPIVETSSIANARFNYTMCTGHFIDIKKVSNYLEWGGQSNCMLSASSVYVHEIYMDLYDTCVGALCLYLEHIFNERGPEGSYAKIQTAVGKNICESGGGDRTYEQRAKVRVKSVDFGPFWDRDNVIKKCDVEVG